MDKNERKYMKNPRAGANPLSIITFAWLFKTILRGYSKEFQEEDLYAPLNEHTSSVLGERIVKIWDEEQVRCNEKKNGSKPSLIKVLFKCFGGPILLIGVAEIIQEFGIKLIQPILLAKILHYLSEQQGALNQDVYIWAFAFYSCSFIKCFLQHNSAQGLMHIGMKIRVACCTLVYRKILRLSYVVLENGISIGQIVNLLSNDVNRVEYSIIFLNYIWLGPIQIMVIAYLLSLEVGWPGVAGIMLFILFIPTQGYFGRKVMKLTRLSAVRTDERLRLMNQILNGVQVIKMYVWEKPFSDLVAKARRKELQAIKKYSILEEFVLTTDLYVPRTSVFLTVLAYVLMGNTITAEKVYMITAFFDILRESMNISFGIGIHQIAGAIVSLQRLQEFMSNPEINERPMITNNCDTFNHSPTRPTKDHAILFKEASAKWSTDTSEDTLKRLDFSVKTGGLVIVIGRIGSSKSSLLHAILGELPLTEGTMEVRGKLVYASQQPWLFASSVRQNILFGNAMDKPRYDKVLEVCQLRADIKQLPHGDRTIVGERGISLSGGQRARINLARAVYADSDIILMDDPLSAVDPNVGQKIMDECIKDYLKNKTRILVTHQLQYLKYADRVIVLNNGSILAQGTYDELQASGLDFIAMMKDKVVDNKNKDEDGDSESLLSLLSMSESNTFEHRKVSKIEQRKVSNNNVELQGDPIEIAEARTMGKVSLGVYTAYFKAAKSTFLIVIMMLVFVTSAFMGSAGDYFIAFWVNTEESRTLDSGNGPYLFNWIGPLTRDHFVYMYAGMIAATIFFALLQVVSYYVVCMRSSKNLHGMMFNSVVRSNMYFFNTNPAGRILNRFAKDMGAVDTKLPTTLFDVIVISLVVLAVCIIIAVVSPWLIIVIIVTVIFVYMLKQVYLRTSRSVKRLEGITRSPVFDHVGATLQGLTTVRAFRAEQILTHEFDNHQDLNSSAFFIYLSASRLFGLYMEFICMICSCVIVFTLLLISDTVQVGDLGLIITQCLSITALIQWGVRQLTEMENQMTSVERILEYSRLEEEPQLDSKPNIELPKDWPSAGRIQFVDVKVKYSPKGSYALENINFTISPGEKIGVVGRTGAGKSSLINALFRLAYVEGDIIIDDISTGSIGLHDYRSKISIIPQEPIIFSGSLRRNLDPFEEYSDDVIWQALDEVELKDTICNMESGLHTVVSEDGTNFSVGQRQLLCLARAILRNNKIMILDEATANVDPHTDSQIQQTITKTFKCCSVITIAHRLNTVMNCDKILVMDKGHVVEFEHPHILLQRKDYFYNMVQRTGTAMAALLIEAAQKSYMEKQAADVQAE